MFSFFKNREIKRREIKNREIKRREIENREIKRRLAEVAVHPDQLDYSLRLRRAMRFGNKW